MILPVLAALSLLLGTAPEVSSQSSLRLVDPLIGTAAEGQTFPATGVPFAMTQWTPQTRDGEVKCVSPYYYGDTKIQGFRGSHFLSGSCTQDYGSLTLMPLLSARSVDAAGRASRFSHEKEQSTPYEYSVDLLDSGIHADLTSTVRSGMMRFRFPEAASHGFIAVQENHRLGSGHIQIDPKRQEIIGDNPVYRIYAGEGRPAGFAGYFIVQFSRPFEVGGVWSGAERLDGALQQEGNSSPAGAFISFDLRQSREVLVRVGTSFTSVEEARRNLAELPDWNFDRVVANAREDWTKALSPIELGPDVPPGDRTIFYTALYHAMLLPRVASDRSGTYPRFGGGDHTEVARGFTYYDDFSLWDTFRAVHPLLTLLDPLRERDMVRSLIAKGEQGKFLPIFPAWSSFTSEMLGDHADAVITDAYAKGIRDFDVQSAYRLMKKNATESPESHALYMDGRGRRGLESYLRYGYIPLDDHIPDAFHHDEQVSRTLEYAYDDFLVGEMASWSGHPEDVKAFQLRAQNYRFVIDPATGYARGRHADGSWVTPFEPNKPASWITEGVPSQYSFFAPQDVPGLIERMGGKQRFTERLDALFSSGSYDQGNEPSHHIAYLYNFVGVPEKTQQHVRSILRDTYKAGPDGLAGNDDAGQISAWYVFSALGFYPVTPGTPRYELGVPLFDEARLRLSNGRSLHIVAPGASTGRYKVLRVTLNGRSLGRSYILHNELLAGGELRFTLDPVIRMSPNSHRTHP